jgi:hypothetical protein
MDVMWNRLWCISGKCNRISKSGISAGGAVITSQADITNTLTSCFICTCIYHDYEPSFRVLKEDTKTLPLTFSSCVSKTYNTPFIMNKLLAALKSCDSMSAGPSGIHNQMPDHPPPTGKEFLLSVYSQLWTENSIRAAWREAVVVPILKTNEDHCLATSYRSISLTTVRQPGENPCRGMWGMVALVQCRGNVYYQVD